ncbi:long-chain fatty acid--CoA ligase [Filobacillus milosensis]|uniref:Long-chain fatty acid--CoA ligase n=1 Tax=Filobacillus milosensis TaxID=94137 RepID=A0A4Y8ID72_9BACI|nr:long-chain fatty acid--CoA ligase [Filobacillus milosensis]TFB13922.1 long-chain fatty acid--CoA ligase [Filobacillus milosensis]
MQTEIDWIGKRAQLFSNDRAIIDADTDESWTYFEINERAEQLAAILVDHQVNKGDRVALLAPNHVSYLDFLFACMKIGAIFVPLNWRLSTDELQYVVNDSGPTFIAVHQLFSEEHEWLEPSMIIKTNDYINSNHLNDIPLSVVDISEKDPLAMVYTGGTTGKPKGAVLSHQSIFWNAINTIVSWNLTKEDCTLTTIPMFHTGGLNALTTPILLAGGTVVLRSTFDPEEAVEELINYRCTTVLFIPTMYHMIVQTEMFKQADFPDMKVFLSGGAPCPLTVYEAFKNKGLKFKEGYGLTEAGPNNFYIDPDEALLHQGSVGRAMLFNEIKIVDEDGAEVDVNVNGELWLKGKHLFECYWNNEEETRNAFIQDWFLTGDLARRDAAGYVYIAGRKKEMIISGGENIYPLEIEHWLQSHEQVNEVAVVGLPHDKWGEVVAAFVSLCDGHMTEEVLVKYCEQKLSRYKIPKKFYMVDELPKTHVGKIDKNALVKEYSNI